MYTQLLANLAILVLAGFVGFAVISKVPNTLHTPLMSGTNAIHGIVVLGALLVLGSLPPTLTGVCGSSASSRWCSARSTSSADSW
jgi:NAD/NADP transhydrogenase alpha subunit